eukprot:Selendium_serpulae@DN3223_c0_g1_i1.p1
MWRRFIYSVTHPFEPYTSSICHGTQDPTATAPGAAVGGGSGEGPLTCLLDCVAPLCLAQPMLLRADDANSIYAHSYHPSAGVAPNRSAANVGPHPHNPCIYQCIQSKRESPITTHRRVEAPPGDTEPLWADPRCTTLTHRALAEAETRRQAGATSSQLSKRI